MGVENMFTILIYKKIENIEYKVIEGILTYEQPFCMRSGCVFYNK